MPFFNMLAREVQLKIVYYGPGLCGKTTNLRYVYERTTPSARGQLITLETTSERTLFFDFLPLQLGSIRGFKARLQLYTVPGQVFYAASRSLIMRGVDGVVFVADSQESRLENNIESFDDLEHVLHQQNRSLSTTPHVIQYNKRDLPMSLSVEQLRAHLNRYQASEFEADARQGSGVFETLKGISKNVFQQLQ